MSPAFEEAIVALEVRPLAFVPAITQHLHEAPDSSSITIIPPSPNRRCRRWKVSEMLLMLLQQQLFCV
jgi:hypothetical protein